MIKVDRPLEEMVVTSPYGNRTLNGVKEFHKGVDLKANSTTKVYACFDGYIFVGKNDSAGTYIVLSDSNGNKAHYYHLSQVVAKNSPKVLSGACIGICGNTGRAYGVHLHFGLFDKEGNHYDPMLFIKPYRTKSFMIWGKKYDIPYVMVEEENYIRFKDLERIGLGKIGYDATNKLPKLDR